MDNLPLHTYYISLEQKVEARLGFRAQSELGSTHGGVEDRVSSRRNSEAQAAEFSFIGFMY